MRKIRGDFKRRNKASSEKQKGVVRRISHLTFAKSLAFAKCDYCVVRPESDRNPGAEEKRVE